MNSRKKSFDLARLPGEGNWNYLFFVDLGNATTEITHNNNPRALYHRYLTTEESCAGIWSSRPFGRGVQKGNTDSPFIGYEAEDWEMSYHSCLEFANRTAVGKLSEIRFQVLPIKVMIAWGIYIGLGPGIHNIF
ncbi:hypothetical protein ACIBPB_30455 [Micromonospora sp. NPDC049836]|uniref:hypothetical protein n=1 Tax=Micromonospora sp. NPDC049836 TaxID=3364274 RepID=UPI003796D0CC